MKKKIIIANWKMNLNLAQTISLTKDIFNGLKKFKKDLAKIDLVLCPSFPYLIEVKKIISKLNISLGAQDCFWEECGSYTGEVSPLQLKEIGCQYVIVGHSERRENLKETDEMVHEKIKTILKNDLIPIICIGETFEERQKGLKDYIIINQISKVLEGINLTTDKKIVVAYEPVWVIGSGRALNPIELDYINKIIFQRLIDLYPLLIVKNNFRIIYGGSVDRKNIKKFLEREMVDGVLVGGASLKASEFIEMVKQLIC
jgi:triosephosphate isomerase